jgi:hypothetical protein
MVAKKKYFEKDFSESLNEVSSKGFELNDGKVYTHDVYVGMDVEVSGEHGVYAFTDTGKKVQYVSYMGPVVEVEPVRQGCKFNLPGCKSTGCNFKGIACRSKGGNIQYVNFTDDQHNIDDVKKVLITHMHVDHVKSIRAFENKDLFMHYDTQMNECNLFEYYESFSLLGFKIYTLPASHDSAGTTGFIIEYNNEKMAYITDTGYIHENIQRYINNCDIYCIESNHDPRLLMLTKRPMFLKNRILSVNGHLSNQDCAYVLGNVMGPKTKEIVFLHRSQEANTEDMVINTFISTMEKMGVDYSSIKVNIAKQNEVVSCGKVSELLENK